MKEEKNEEKTEGFSGVVNQEFIQEEMSLVHININSKAVMPKLVSQEDLSKGNLSKVYEIMSEYLSFEPEVLQRSICNHLEFSLAITRFNMDKLSLYRATAMSIRDRITERWNDTQAEFKKKNLKRVYFISMEFLMGRAFQNAVVNIGVKTNLERALLEMGYKLEDLYEEECDQALGNGGIGRMAACFMDSLATMNYPAWGYGIRYSYGMFRQKISDGFQIEVPDYWLNNGNPWVRFHLPFSKLSESFWWSS